jgi:hypothetical protein
MLKIRNNGRVSLVVAMGLLAAGCGGKGGDSATGQQKQGYAAPDRAGQYTKAMESYGPLSVSPSPVDDDLYAEADSKPWASYWYPTLDDILIAPQARNGNQPTLDKYDRYSKERFGKASSALKAEASDIKMYNPSADPAEGRCGSWVMAAALEPEPQLPLSGVKVPGTDVTWYTRDVKALMIKSYELVKNHSDRDGFHRFGVPYTGPVDDRGNTEDMQDIYPDQLHRILQVELFQKHRVVLVDHEASDKVWNVPVYQAAMRITRDPAQDFVMHVALSLTAAESLHISPDYSSRYSPSGHGMLPFTIRAYTYDLYGYPQADGSLQVAYGKWTGDSVANHPDYVLTLPDSGAVDHYSGNAQIDMSVLADIFARTGALHQPFESILSFADIE